MKLLKYDIKTCVIQSCNVKNLPKLNIRSSHRSCHVIPGVLLIYIYIYVIIRSTRDHTYHQQVLVRSAHVSSDRFKHVSYAQVVCGTKRTYPVIFYLVFSCTSSLFSFIHIFFIHCVYHHEIRSKSRGNLRAAQNRCGLKLNE